MSKFTKQAIMDGFIELSKQMPIDKITVKKVTDYATVKTMPLDEAKAAHFTITIRISMHCWRRLLLQRRRNYLS